MPFPTIFTSLKAISSFPGWSEPESETGYLWFNATIDIAGVTEEGVLLHGGCYRRIPDEAVTFELRARSPGARRTMPMARVEWRSLRKGHTNSRRAGSPVSGKRVSRTHYHSFALNWLEPEQRMRRGNLPQAEEIDQDIQSFESLASHVGNLFRINNMRIVERPPWVYDLFQDDH